MSELCQFLDSLVKEYKIMNIFSINVYIIET